MKIFIIHKWRQEYLLCCIKQLLKYNDAKDIVFLTDDKKLTKKYIWENDITYENISDYFKSANEFAKYYQHRSYNKAEYELFCMQRRLILNEYINSHNINIISHIDTDVLIYCNMKEYYSQNLIWIDFSCTWWSWWIFFGTKKWLNSFSAFLMDCYKNNFYTLEPYFTWKIIPQVRRWDWYIYYDKTNCVTDMTLFYKFLKEWIKNSDLQVKDIWLINDSVVFDSAITTPDWFEYIWWLKRIKRENNVPYCYLKNKKEKIYFYWLHFQWESKIFMKKYYDRTFSLWHFLPQLKYRIKKYFIEFCEFVFRVLWIHSLMRNIRLKIIRRWIDPKSKLHIF